MDMRDIQMLRARYDAVTLATSKLEGVRGGGGGGERKIMVGEAHQARVIGRSLSERARVPLNRDLR